jgi:hypothetical protein
MDWNTVTTVAAVVAAAGAILATLLSFVSWRLQHANQVENAKYKERLRLEEHYFKLHLLWQDLHVAAVTLESIPRAVPDYVPHIEALPITQLTEALATKDLLSPETATLVRIVRDELIQLEQLSGDSRNADARRRTDFDKKFPEQLSKTLANLELAGQAILSQLPA